MVYVADNLKILFVFSIEKQIIGNEIDESKITINISANKSRFFVIIS